MSERPFEPPASVELRYAEMRCRRYLFDRSFETERSPATNAAGPGPAAAPSREERPGGAERSQ